MDLRNPSHQGSDRVSPHDEQAAAISRLGLANLVPGGDFSWMMVLSALRPDASLPEFLVYRARSASVRRLAIDGLIGVAGSVAALWWKPVGWLVFASVAVCFVSYGAWGLLDRVRSRPAPEISPRIRGLLDAMCALCALLGALAAAGVLLGVWALALGTWIS